MSRGAVMCGPRPPTIPPQPPSPPDPLIYTNGGERFFRSVYLFHCSLGAFAGSSVCLPECPFFCFYPWCRGRRFLLPHVCVFNTLRIQQGIQKCRQKAENIFEGPALDPPAHAAGAGVSIPQLERYL